MRMRVSLVLVFIFSSLTPPSGCNALAGPDPATFLIINLEETENEKGEKIIPHLLSGLTKKEHKENSATTNTFVDVINAIDPDEEISLDQRDINEVDTRALNILDKINAQEADEFGRKCVNKTMMRRETEYEEVMTCEHSYDERCHTSYTTTYEPHQEEECEERFRKVCMISQEHKSVTEMVEECTTPLVPNCTEAAEDVCRTVYDTVCDTKQVPYEVTDQFPVCTTVNMTKCGDVTTGLLTEERCVVWPTQQCTVETRTVNHTNSETECRKEPRELCAPGDCPLVQGPPLCQEKTKTVVVDHPVEQCDLEPSQTCKQVTKLVPQLKPTQECVQVPKEVCATSRLRPTIKNVPFIQKWCFKPSLSTLTQPDSTTTTTQPPATTTQPPATTTQPPATTTPGKVSILVYR